VSRFSDLRSDSPLLSMRIHASIKAVCNGPVALIEDSRNSRPFCALRSCAQQISTSCSLVGHVFTLKWGNECASSNHISRELLSVFETDSFISIVVFHHAKNCARHRNKNCPK
jgi:hypothetical protein